MKTPAAAATETRFAEQQLTDELRKHLDRRMWLKNFALVFGLIVATVTVATVLANWGSFR